MRLGLIASPEFQRHETGDHVENRTRLQALEKLWPTLPLWQPQPLRSASDAELTCCHVPSVLERVSAICAAGGGHLDGDTLTSPASEEVARTAVGSSLQLLERILAGELDRGFAAVRPPGHHATPVRPMGFCLYSTAAIVARQAVERYGVERVLLLDWDVHHGNGSQDCLEDLPQVRFVSLHQWPLYPGTGWYDERGCGNLFNVPLPRGCGDAEYLYALQVLVEPWLEKWQPQLILVSAGYDAHRRDPLGGMGVTGAGFRALASRVAHWSERYCDSRLLGLLEGGYDLQGLTEAVQATLRAWEAPGAAETVSTEKVHLAAAERIREIERLWTI
jgi:acetoin utilization deacetylase AcuC-like enzyme